MSNPLTILADVEKLEPFISKITTLITQAQTIDADGDGVPDIEEFKTLGTKIVGDFGVLKTDIEKAANLAVKVEEYIKSKS